MGRIGKLAGPGLVVGLLLTLSAAGQAPSLSQARGGLWEVTGAPGSSQPIRQCIPDTRTLAQFEHRGQPCPRTVIGESGPSTTIQYNCGAPGFGTSRITVVTPRSLRIETQGIADNLPFNYVMQARRLGDCRAH
jgi:hypothetical protein